MSSVVYFARAKDGSIKIGTSAQVDRRARNLNGMVPGGCEVVCSVSGGRALEAHLHEALTDSRISGEWFRPDDLVVQTMERIRRFGAAAVPAGFAPDDVQPMAKLSEDRARLQAEVQALLRACAEPYEIGDSIKAQVTRAARRTGLTITRTENLWYGEGRIVPAEEYFRIVATAIRHARSPEPIRLIVERLNGIADVFDRRLTDASPEKGGA